MLRRRNLGTAIGRTLAAVHTTSTTLLLKKGRQGQRLDVNLEGRHVVRAPTGMEGTGAINVGLVDVPPRSGNEHDDGEQRGLFRPPSDIDSR